ncbi:septum formation family protein [Arthrobacter sp. CAN_C5]|uniref:septum formation family protein n=1 Tax=Arthrobacter sp. CAN_C5 TaxID=2760706 RepID=UPI001AE33A02|nr:septum formation family protein [Arthrobacter sp. CAN_C5]MBP2215441.1 hypothetical protein [Arthrobacter sp. CAN_C5]
MSDQEHTPRDSEAEPDHNDTQPPQVDPFHVDEPQLVDADAVELADAEVSPETVEPELSVSADDLHLVEPSLNPARISEDTARAASLEETAAEARRVEQEALDAGALVAGTVPASDPASQAAPAGTAPAGGAAGDTTAEVPAAAGETPDADAAASTTRGTPEVDGTSATRPAEAAIDGSAEDANGAPDSDAPESGAPESRGPGSDIAAPDAAAPVADAPAVGDASVGENANPFGGPLDSNDTTRSLPSFAADGEAPRWTPAATDEQRWDELFDQTEHGTQMGTTPDSPDADSAAPGAPPAVVVGTAHANPGAAPSEKAQSGAAPSKKAQSGAAPSKKAQSGAVPSGGPYGLPAAGAHPARGEGRQDPGKSPRNRNLLIGGALLGLLALGLLIWGLIALIGGLTATPDREPVVNGTPGADGIIAENVLPLDIEEGQCLRDFVDINSESTVVTCSTPHNAQLLATAFYAEGDAFPGDDALALRAQEVCDGVDLDEGTAARYESLELLRVTPRQGSWSEGDRRVDCVVTSSEGNIISDTLINE